MSRKKALLLAALVGALVILALPFALRWSRTCDQERARASETWAQYAEHLGDTAAGDEVRAVLASIEHDVPDALERGESELATPPPGDVEGARLYREAMERLVLAEGACGNAE